MIFQIKNGKKTLIAEVNKPYAIITDWDKNIKYDINAVTLKDDVLKRWNGTEWIDFLNCKCNDNSIYLTTENGEKLLTEQNEFLITGGQNA